MSEFDRMKQQKDEILQRQREALERPFLAQIDSLNLTVKTLRADLAGHQKHVGRFLTELHAVMIDPLAEGEIKVEEMCRLLLARAIEQRDQDYKLRADLAAAQEWKTSVLAAVKNIPEFTTGKWAGDKEGWAFVFELVNWLQRHRVGKERELAEAKRRASYRCRDCGARWAVHHAPLCPLGLNAEEALKSTPEG